ncbi:acyl-CoA thioesterase [Minwuia sp.]|uniref:acyl-CoA thioesterase n=1 Tax=Minwuia sp. TaxID=2493630 RepID=UPI003A91836A
MAGWTETFRGVIYPWHCDHMGHMNVMYYVNFFDQGAGHLLSACGFKWSEMGDQQIGFADVKHVIEYRAEQKVGSLITVESGILKRGRTSLVAAHRMLNVETGALAATMEVTTIQFDLAERKSMPLPEETWPLIDALIVEAE